MSATPAVVTTKKWHRYNTGDVADIFGLRVVVGRVLSRNRFEVSGIAKEKAMKPISDEMRRVLKKIKRSPWSTPKSCRCSYRTYVALSSRGLIQVTTTFGMVAYPRTAEAVITDLGEAALRGI